MKKKLLLVFAILVVILPVLVNAQTSDYTERFLEMWNEIHDPANGYFSPDGAPYHAVETLLCEAPDYGHETTSEAYSYWLWLEAMYGRVTGDWSYLNNAWQTMEDQIIPTSQLQPGNSVYDPSSPATYAAEYPLPDNYPSQLNFDSPVGQDPISSELTSTYGTSELYGMHWLLDCDNFYGYGIQGDGVSTPSYINTFQRGVQESVWETVPHPSWEDFSWGGPNGYLDLFTGDANYAQQWRYTNAPDADARAVQVIYWASEWVREQGLDPNSVLPIEEAKRMGDCLRLAMFDKYFKPIGAQSPDATGSGRDSAHYLLSWYYAWGGGLNGDWAWRIGCSHAHFGYQNPVAAWALSTQSDFIPDSPTAQSDWSSSLQRQLEFYRWLQSAEGAIAGGATNSWNGAYEAYPAGKSTFYDMAYDDHPVYHDPGSNTWFGWQAWSMERVAEYYYLTNDSLAEDILANWVPWARSAVQLTGGSYQVPATLGWSGQPDTWNPNSPGSNNGLHVSIEEYNQDVGIASCLAKAFIYYAAATQKYGTLDTATRDMAKSLIDSMWDNYRDSLGVSAPESRSEFNRFFEQEVYIPSGWSGQMPNGDVIEPGVTFIDIRSDYRNDPDWSSLEAAYQSGQDYVQTYHRTWAQIDVALANAEYSRFFFVEIPTPTPTGFVPTPTNTPFITATPTPTPTSTSIPTPTPTPTSGGQATTISVPFTQDGAGSYYWVTSSLGNYLNSWNMDVVEINGVDVTNKYVGTWDFSSIPTVNGSYYITYEASYPWSHFEIR